MDARTGLPVVGVLGAGPLVRLTHHAAIALGQSLRVFVQPGDDAAALAGAEVTVGDYGSFEDLRAFAEGCDVVNVLDERVPSDLLHRLAADGVAVHPGADAWRFVRDAERRLASSGIEVAAGSSDVARELLVLVARSPYGQGAAWPVAETVRRDGAPAQVAAPAPGLPAARSERAQRLALRIAAESGATGVLAVELVETTAGRLLVASLSAGPHPAGNWTVAGASTSQYEQHLRAVLDYPFGATSLLAPAVVTATVVAASGQTVPRGIDERVHHCMAHWPDVKIHLYGLRGVAGSEIGHVTALGKDLEKVRERAESAARYLTHGGRL